MASDCEITAFDVLRTWTFDHLKILMIEATELEAEWIVRNARLEVKDGYSDSTFSYRICLSREFHGIARLVIFLAVPLCSFGIEFDIAIE
ncbi:hypothetical protein BOTNAR_0236g00080 [Botryotinia narcissicola]|uniref:Uncharacterized protein n=1 Tax=Botryotinia narcissicola TaxID=278944 RepID=A0A4Z1IAE2_9HELO|nr:hypothetical protein BOTNAR_0236g00080 [Botryotinia narcissicola]